jgi:hypothetical protein
MVVISSTQTVVDMHTINRNDMYGKESSRMKPPTLSALKPGAYMQRAHNTLSRMRIVTGWRCYRRMF